MPYSSQAQRRFFHTDTARKAGITAADVEEWDKTSKGLKLPEKAPEKAASLLLKAADLIPPPKPPMQPSTPGARQTGVLKAPANAPAPGVRSAVRNASSSSAFESTDSKLDQGANLTMPMAE